MTDWVPIRYRGFWDVPRIFLARVAGRLVLFDCPFSEELDDYPDVYEVFDLPPHLDDEQLPTDWTLLRDTAVGHLGTVPVDHVRFDPTRRAFVDAAILEEVAGPAVRLGEPPDRG